MSPSKKACKPPSRTNMKKMPPSRKIWKNTTIEEKKGSQICMLKWHTYQVCLHIFHAITWKCILFFPSVIHKMLWEKKHYIIWPSKKQKKKMKDGGRWNITHIKYKIHICWNSLCFSLVINLILFRNISTQSRGV